VAAAKCLSVHAFLSRVLSAQSSAPHCSDHGAGMARRALRVDPGDDPAQAMQETSSAVTPQGQACGRGRDPFTKTSNGRLLV
jgi:hypothetical protein